MSEIHITAVEAGSLAAAAGVGTLVLTHLAPSDPTLVTTEQWRAAASQDFDGTVVVGQHLLRLPVRTPAVRR